MGLDAARGLLACPVCAEGLDLGPAAATCRQGHSFDVARQGHLNLLGAAQPANADTAAMVEARSRVLDSGAFDAVDAALARRATGARTILDVGGGTGHHLARLLDATDGADIGYVLNVYNYMSPSVLRLLRRRGIPTRAEPWNCSPGRPTRMSVRPCGPGCCRTCRWLRGRRSGLDRVRHEGPRFLPTCRMPGSFVPFGAIRQRRRRQSCCWRLGIGIQPIGPAQ